MFCPQDDPDRSRLERLLAEMRRIGSTVPVAFKF
jgi:hypothetical protein